MIVVLCIHQKIEQFNHNSSSNNRVKDDRVEMCMFYVNENLHSLTPDQRMVI